MSHHRHHGHHSTHTVRLGLFAQTILIIAGVTTFCLVLHLL